MILAFLFVLQPLQLGEDLQSLKIPSYIYCTVILNMEQVYLYAEVRLKKRDKNSTTATTSKI